MNKLYQTHIAYWLIFVASIGDMITTAVGLTLGFTETRIFHIPFLSSLILFAAAWLINQKWNHAPTQITSLTTNCIVTVAFTPILWHGIVFAANLL